MVLDLDVFESFVIVNRGLDVLVSIAILRSLYKGVTTPIDCLHRKVDGGEYRMGKIEGIGMRN